MNDDKDKGYIDTYLERKLFPASKLMPRNMMEEIVDRQLADEEAQGAGPQVPVEYQPMSSLGVFITLACLYPFGLLIAAGIAGAGINLTKWKADDPGTYFGILLMTAGFVALGYLLFQPFRLLYRLFKRLRRRGESSV